jgi:hypothetical protein
MFCFHLHFLASVYVNFSALAARKQTRPLPRSHYPLPPHYTVYFSFIIINNTLKRYAILYDLFYDILSCSVVNNTHSGGEAARLITYLDIAPRFTISEPTPPLPLHAVMVCTGTASTFIFSEVIYG